MTVEHMKWWGWGREGVGFHFEDKPAFAPFVEHAVGLDLHSAPAVDVPSFEDIDVPASQAPDALLGELRGAIGDEHVVLDDLDRVVHTYGKSIRDLIRVRAGILPRIPDVVAYPGDEDDVTRIVQVASAANAVLIPFGGGSNIAGSLEPTASETRPIISVDMGRMRLLVDIDEPAQIARIQAGALGPDLEAQLNAKGWTLGHFPDSFTHSTLGGWVATRSSGMQSDKYGDIAEITRGLRVVRPDGTLVIRAMPNASTGPSVREMVLGSEGRLGIITEVSVQVHRVPEERVIHAYFFPRWNVALGAMQAIAASDAAPSITRVSDARETAFSMSTSKVRTGTSRILAEEVLPRIMKSKGWDLDEICMSFIGYEGSPAHVRRQRAAVEKIVKAYGGMGVGTGPGVLYDQKKFDTPYLRDFLLDRGAVADVSETVAPWSRLLELYDATVASANAAYERIGQPGWIMCHLSHSYHSGACLYFTFAWVAGGDEITEYETVKSAIQQSFVDHGGAISHHHGVGFEHAPWLEQDISAEGVTVMRGLFAASDPQRILNPGAIVAD
ncbi:FAD-binding oxidoreductase [Agrococcus jejuensis]|uniref:FAD-binding oxidoreductase n=1 Tax=Agrococcus jejuensis TaxID=399736 RepID=UPI00119F24F4|nr:FAD-binding oxidoreductase [Agrococcus jejuensis]